MPDLFGAPLGDIAYHKDAQTQMQTAATAADISLTPARKRLLEAQAGSAETLAAGRRADSDALNASRKWEAAYRKDKIKKERLEAMSVMEPLSTGRQMTVADLPDDEYAPENAQLDYANWLEKGGAPYALWGPIQDQGIENSRKEAMIEYRKAQAGSSKLDDQIQRQKQLGEMASDAGSSELAWLHATQDPLIRKMLPPQLLGMPYKDAKPSLDVIAKAATSRVEEATAKRAQAKEDRAKLLAADQKLYYKSLKAKIDTQTKVAEDTLERTKKYDGFKSQTARDASEALVESRRLQTLMNRLAVATPMPISMDELVEDTAYTSRDGKIHAIFKGMDEAGDPIFDPIGPGEMQRLIQKARRKNKKDPFGGLKLEQ